jgi:hypothetical protein
MTKTNLSAAQKMTIDVAIASLDFLKDAAQSLDIPVDQLTEQNLLEFAAVERSRIGSIRNE